MRVEQIRAMSWTTEPPMHIVYRRAEREEQYADDRRLRARLHRGELVRISRGAFAAASDWSQLQPIERHAQRVWEAAARLSPGRVFSHHAAAALWGMELLGAWPERIDVIGGGGSSGNIRRHRIDDSDVATMPWLDHFVTTPAQTAVHLAASLPYTHGVVAADQALWARRRGGSLTTRAQVLEVAERHRGRSHARVQRVAEFARPGADSVRESQSRVIIASLGFPEPELQRRFVLRSGRVAYVDFWWEEHSHVGEFDGVGKYVDPRLLKGRSPERALLEEKDRGDELRREVRVVSRWRTPTLSRPRELYDLLTGDGLPSARPRPGR